ncbi:SDR family oxidoreductase [Chitinophaga sp. G-6-1-13]|uniref:SDR family oxidoreductase n=1 Tax=Chitinophaga fulva TaxID=2728842 RepID=A0A848GN63_9BACT|nr:SDR family NAD(P)-dependent oxidoreductase [Chitinophaga fulva]NML39367.1 SDR family oxidoreductase [Chitinophaga fulva]
MDLQLASKRVFISGSTQGIGFAIAQQMAQEGAEVILHGRTQVKVDWAIQKLTALCPEAVVSGISADLAIPEEMEILLQRLPSVDILVNNAGIFEVKDFWEITDANWLHIFNVNVMSAVRLSRYVIF